MEPIITINNLIDDAKCYQVVRMLRWPDGQVICPLCESTQIDKH
ncbi:MAG: transposase, partial [ANME-2 cluster archaeon]|nr:transposase [ANME-2 cluster archaeon]